MSAQTSSGYELTINRHFPADRDTVFSAWTTAEALTQWFAPSNDSKTVVLELDVRVGGRYRIEMHEPDGIHTVYGEYVSIDAPEKIVFTWAWEGSDDDTPMLVTVELREEKGGTAMSLLHEKLPSEHLRDLHNEGWNGCLSRLDALIQKGE